MRARLLVVSLAAAAVPWPAPANPVTHDPCAGTVAGPVVWKQLGNDVLENLLFSGGSMWVSDTSRSSVLRLAASEAETGAVTGIPNPGGLAEGTDGLIYAGYASGAFNALARTGASRVVRFDPADLAAGIQTYAQGFSMANGMTFGPGDDLYVSNDFDYGLVRIPRANPAAWHEFARVWGTNGLVVDEAGANLYAAITFDQRSPIERVPLGNPAAHTTAAQLTFGVLSLEPGVHTDPNTGAPLVGLKGLDDMTRDTHPLRDRSALYVVANGMGELLRVNPSNGTACLVAGGLQNPSSVRIAPETSGFADGLSSTIDLYVTEFSGAIRRVRFTP